MKPSKSFWLFLSAVLSLTFAASGQTVSGFYVAPDGSDTNPGTLTQPFATLERAQLAVRSLTPDQMDHDITVWLRSGTYRLNKPLRFGPADGGNNRIKVTYAAYPRELPVITGGLTIPAWHPAGNNLWQTTLDSVKAGRWWFRQLYADGRKLSRSRYPQTGFLKIRSVSSDLKTIQLTQPLPEFTSLDPDSELIVVQNWSITRERVTAVKGDTVIVQTPAGWAGHTHCLAKPGMSVFFEQALPFVKEPGQWHLNRSSGTLSYLAAPGENPNQKTFIAPNLQQLMIISGTAEQPVRNLHFKGLTFEYTDFDLPKIGYNGIQACYYGNSTQEARTFAVDVAVELNYCQNCSITDSRLTRLGGSAIGLGPGCYRNHIVGCQISQIGATGVNVGHMKIKDPLWADWTDPRDVPVANEVANCYIHHCGEDFWGAHAVFDAMTRDTHIHHNEIAWIPYGGIATGFVWNTLRTSQQGCVIEYNHVHDVMLRLNDSGCIYTLGFQPGSIIRGNLLHGVRFGGYAGGQVCNNGIFFDEGSKGFLLEGNVIYDVDQKPGSRNTPVRYNHSSHDWHIWIDNTIQVEPTPPAAAKDLAERAGLEPDYRYLLKGRDR